MVGSKDLEPSTIPFFPNVFFNNQFRAKPQWPDPETNLSGQTAIVTGANTGLGYEAALQLLGLKLSHLVIAVRSIKRGEAAATKLRALHPEAKVDVWELDMCSYDSVLAFSRRVDADLLRIDLVLLNAGIGKMGFAVVESTGHEEIMQVNYLSTMLLAVLLLPTLQTKGPPGQPAHLVIVNAALSLAAKPPSRDQVPLLSSLDEKKNFHSRDQYNMSKLFAHMFLWNLVDYVSADDVIVSLADPAWCRDTELTREVKGPLMKTGRMLFSLTGRTPQVGASCFVDALVNKGKESHGCFLMSWKIHPFAAFLYSPEGAEVTKRLWDETMAELDFAGVRNILASLKK